MVGLKDDREAGVPACRKAVVIAAGDACSTLARQLLERFASAGDAEQRISVAFHEFMRLLDRGESTALAALAELQRVNESSHPAAYFLETLQAEANRGERKKRGVYFTPGPVVDFMLRRVEQLAPPGPLVIVDPACGGGVFLLAAAEAARRRPGSRLVGFDISPAAIEATRTMLADCAVPLHWECTNSLLAGEELAERLSPGEGTLVILGNPPYANYGRLNRGKWIDGLLADYRRGVAEQKLNLTDDFIKFLRWGQHWIDRAGRGILAMITSRTYLTGLTHRGMRRSLAESFARIEIVDLHGDEAEGDENIFPIRRGVAIGVFTRAEGRGQRAEGGEISDFGFQISDLGGVRRYWSVVGSREEKFEWLRSWEGGSREGGSWEGDAPAEPVRLRLGGSLALPWIALACTPPQWLLAPEAGRSAGGASEYLRWPRLDEIFARFISGVQTKNDALLVDFDRAALAERMQAYLGEREGTFDAAKIQPYVVGPFDRRWIYYDRALVGRSRWPVMRNMLCDSSGRATNVGLVFMRQSTGDAYDHAMVVDCLASDRVFYSRRGAPFLALLWGGEGETGNGDPPSRFPFPVSRFPNFRAEWISESAARMGFEPAAESPFAYVYAVLNAVTYRERFLPELKCDFPRIPWPRSKEGFVRLAGLGQQLIDCHLSGRSTSPLPPARLPACSPALPIARGYPKLADGMVYINRADALPGIDADAWSFRIGGYRVIERWLKARQGRRLNGGDVAYLQSLAAVAAQTRQITAEIDEAIEGVL